MVLNNTKGKYDRLGHFFILCPDNAGFITIYDYPKEIHTYPANYLASILKQNGINKIPIIICEPKNSKDNEETKHIRNFLKEVVLNDFNNNMIEQLNFGNIAEGSSLKCTFRLKNNTNSAIELINVEADCKCSSINTEKTILPPGDATRISMVISLLRKYQETAVRGRVQITQVEGSKTIQLFLIVNGYSEPRVLLEPHIIDFGSVKTNSNFSIYKDAKIIKTKYATGKPITRVQPTASNIKISNLRIRDNITMFDILLDSKDSVGLQHSKINVFLGNEQESASYFDISALCVLDFSISPPTAIVEYGKSCEITITPKEQNFTVQKVKTSKLTDLLDLSYINMNDYSKVFIRARKAVTNQELLEDFIEIEIQLDSTGEAKTLKVPLLFIPDSKHTK